jgi:signal transduction histidine kinase
MAGKRTVLRTGFGIVIGLSVLSTFTAYRIQDSFSKRTVEIHRKFVQQQTVLNNLRRTLWAGGIIARDFFLNTAADRSEVFHTQLRDLSAESADLFRQLDRIHPRDEKSVQLRRKFDELFETLAESAELGIQDSQEYSFVQEQIVPRRRAAGLVLQEIERANENSLTQSEEDFTATRRAAAQRLLVMLGAGLLLGVMVTSFSLRYSENLEDQTALQFQEVSHAKLELEKLSARLMEIQEEERTRLSRELHDEIVQNIAVLRIEIMQAQQLGSDRIGDIREHLDRMRNLADRTLRTVRNITVLLRPSLLDDLGLGPALQWLTEDFRRRTGVRCEFADQGLGGDLPDAVKTCVYRVTQEALHNCEKHARATKVNVTVSQFANGILLEVRDDGIGIPHMLSHVTGEPAIAPLHFGIIGMRERAGSLGGTLTVDSAPGMGSRITLLVPLHETSNETPHQTQQISRAETIV